MGKGLSGGRGATQECSSSSALHEPTRCKLSQACVLLWQHWLLLPQQQHMRAASPNISCCQPSHAERTQALTA